MNTWLDDAKRVPVTQVAAELGLTVARDGRSVGPCPGCGIATRANPGRTDRRGRCPILGNGWRCFSNGTEGCGAKGDGPGLVVWVLTGQPWRKGDERTTRAVRAWFAERGWSSEPAGNLAIVPRRVAVAAPQEAPVPLPDPYEVAQAWFHALAVTADTDVCAFLASRGLDPSAVMQLDLARALTAGHLPKWMWRDGRDWHEGGYRLLVPLWQPDPDRPGLLAMVSLHTRCLLPCDGSRKAASPTRHRLRGLVMAPCEDFLADGREQRLLTVCEGVTDYLSWALQPPSARGAVIGGVNGSASDALLACVPTDWTVAVATDADAGGEQQAEAWRRAIERRGCKYVRCHVQQAE